METIETILAEQGGLAGLSPSENLEVELDPFNYMTLARTPESPNGLVCLCLAFFKWKEGQAPCRHTWMHFERTDFCWLPYYFKSLKQGLELEVYHSRPSPGGREVRPEIRSRLMSISWTSKFPKTVLLEIIFFRDFS